MSSSFPDFVWAEIRKEYGEHCMRRREYKKANENFKASLQHQPNKLDSVYLLANSQAREANLESALELLEEKSHLANYKDHIKCNLQECDCNYEKNFFEQSLLLVNEKSFRIQNEIVKIPHTTNTQRHKQRKAKPKGPKLDPLRQRFEMIRANFDDMIGKNAGNCLFEQRRYFDNIMDSWKRGSSNKLEKAPLGDKLTNADECDVVSIHEQNVRDISVKEKYRLENLKQKFAQCYMQSAWKDFEFINELKANKILMQSTQNQKSFDIIDKEIDNCVETTGKMIQQLHARCPLYTYNSRMFPDPAHKLKANKISRFYMQYQTRRDMFLALDDMHKMRARGKLEKLIKIAEHELGFHYQIKSDKLMPRKKEFITELCNLIGLAYLDRLKLPPNCKSMDATQQLSEILEVSIPEKKPAIVYIFGDQSTYRDPAKPDTSFLDFKNKTTRIEFRLKQAQMPVERCHLFHEMGRANLKQNNYEESRNFARKMLDEAAMAGNTLWKIVARILMCRAFLMQKNFSETRENLKIVKGLTDTFGIVELRDVIDWCVKISEELTN